MSVRIEDANNNPLGRNQLLPTPIESTSMASGLAEMIMEDFAAKMEPLFQASDALMGDTTESRIREIISNAVIKLELGIPKETLSELGFGLEDVKYDMVLVEVCSMVTKAVKDLTNKHLRSTNDVSPWTCALVPKENGGIDAILQDY